MFNMSIALIRGIRRRLNKKFIKSAVHEETRKKQDNFSFHTVLNVTIMENFTNKFDFMRSEYFIARKANFSL